MINHLQHIYSCDYCNTEVERFKFLKTIKKDGKKVHICSSCYSKNRKGFRRESVRELAPLVSNSKELIDIIKEKKPKIIVLDENKEKPNRYIPWRYRTEEQRKKTTDYQSKKISIGLTPDEVRLLYSKGYRSGLDTEKCSIRVNQIKAHLSNLVKELKKKNVSEEDINVKFKEEFRKLVTKE